MPRPHKSLMLAVKSVKAKTRVIEVVQAIQQDLDRREDEMEDAPEYIEDQYRD